jgi:DNA-binding SARP family transcriptional activator
MASLKVHLFGRFHATYEDRSMEAFDASKVQELLCYLLLNRKSHAREHLAGVLWADSSTAHAKKYLRQALWQLQVILEANLGALGHRVALVEADWIRLNPALDLWLDVAVFERAFAMMHEAGTHDLSESTAQLVQQAIDLYRGDLLEGFYEDWCLYERERLQTMYLAMLDRLIRYSESHKEYDRGLFYAATALRYEPASERTHRQIMRLHHCAGDRSAALRQYDRCVSSLRTEFGVQPTSRTVELLKRIQADDVDPLSGTNATKASTDTADVLLPEVLEHLKEFRATLSVVQRKVQRDIRNVEVALTGRD